jgi:hypothetical protein
MISRLSNIAMFVIVDFMFRTQLVLKRYISWDIMSCSPLKVTRRFEVSCCRHFQGRRISHARNKGEADLLTSNELHDVMSRKIDLYITIAVGIEV